MTPTILTRLALIGLMVGGAALMATVALADAPIHGSIRLPHVEQKGQEAAEKAEHRGAKTTSEKAQEAQEAQEAKQLARYAKISPEQAIAAARHSLKNMTAKADKVQLENEDDNLVYAVYLDGYEVLVDAGNGKVLATEKESPETND